MTFMQGRICPVENLERPFPSFSCNFYVKWKKQTIFGSASILINSKILINNAERMKGGFENGN